MILIFILGLYCIIVGRVRITRQFALTGTHARGYGILIIALAIPVRLLMSRVLLPLLPKPWLADRLAMALLNAAVLAMFLLGLAWSFRDKRTPDQLR